MRPDVVSAARAWIGTPYLHQTACKGAGTDCLGLIRGVWKEVAGAEPAVVPAYTSDWSEAGQQEELWHAARKYLNEVTRAPILGDVLLFRMRSGAVAKHLGIYSDAENPRFIHAYTRHGVVESPLGTPWRKRIVACFEFP